MGIFISHSQADVEVVRRVSDALIREHFKVWCDTIKLRAGDELSPRIFGAIEASEVFVIVMSAEAAASEWVMRELEFALSLEAEHKFSIVPVRLGSRPGP